jgi:acetyl-CoA C-acetyltransferase
MAGDLLPVLVGVGQAMTQWQAGHDNPPSPIGMALAAAQAALRDAGAPLVGAIDCLMMVRTMRDSLPLKPAPQGACANPPRTLAALLGAAPRRAIYGCVGGDTPQALLAEACELLHRGEARCVLIASGEAVAAERAAARAGVELDWRASAQGEWEDRGFGEIIVDAHEIRHGIALPVQAYALIEHALRARLGRSRSQHIEAMAALFARYSQIAAANPFAQFPQERSADFLAAMSPENYPLADPYRKHLVAQDSVNQGAAVLLMTAGEARALGVPEGNFIYLHGHAQAVEKRMALRPDLSRSPALEGALRLALEAAGKRIEEIAHLDLYSCFACVVFLAAEAAGVDWRARDTSITGGLPFFGGPGNAYSLHAIAQMAQRLRDDRAAFGLICANGGFLSKQAVGIYGARAPAQWQPISSAALQADLNAGPQLKAMATDGMAVIETYTAASRPDGGVFACITARAADGARALAKARSADHETVRALAAGPDPIGRAVFITREGDNSYFRFG